jgi:hypothetical protein
VPDTHTQRKQLRKTTNCHATMENTNSLQRKRERDTHSIEDTRTLNVTTCGLGRREDPRSHKSQRILPSTSKRWSAKAVLRREGVG